MEWKRPDSRLRFQNVVLRAGSLIAATAFFRQHPLAGGGIFGDAGHTSVKRVTLRSRGSAVAAFSCGGSYDGQSECFVIPATFLCNLPCPL